MTATAHLREAYHKTFDGPAFNGQPNLETLMNPSRRTEFAAEYLENLRLVSGEMEAPVAPDVTDDLAYAVLNREASLDERRKHASRAIEGAKEAFFKHAPSVGGVDMPGVYAKSEALSEQFVEAVVQVAGSYPDKPDISNLKTSLSGVIEGEKTPENTAVAAMAMFNVLQPYIVDRLLELNVYDPKQLREQVAGLRYDSALVLRFYNSVSGTARAALTGKSTLSSEEMADELFDIGPIFVQLGQTFSNAANKPGTDTDTKEFLHSIGQAMQEGVAMPNDEQLAKLTKSLPQGLTMKEALSSAKMAYVFNTTSPRGEHATKIKRPGIEQATTDNVRMFSLMTNIVARYIETHAANTRIAKSLSVVKDTLPFGLALIEADITDELDFTDEARLQKRAAEILASHKGIIVPKVLEEYSDDNHITMENVPGKRISDVEANPEYVKNALVLLLRGRRKNALFHGDMHGGNIKAAVEAEPGTLVAYDWGGSFEMPRRFEAKLLPFLVGAVRKNPKTMAKAYRKIQSAKFHQVTQEEAEAAATAAIEAIAERPPVVEQGKRLTKLEKLKQDTNGIFTTFIGLLGKEYQSTLDARYVRYMRSSKALMTVVKQELAKPAYGSKLKRNMTLAKSAAKAVKEVYFTGKGKRNRS